MRTLDHDRTTAARIAESDKLSALTAIRDAIADAQPTFDGLCVDLSSHDIIGYIEGVPAWFGPTPPRLGRPGEGWSAWHGLAQFKIRATGATPLECAANLRAAIKARA